MIMRNKHSRPTGFRILLVIPAAFTLLLMFSFTTPDKLISNFDNLQALQQKPVVKTHVPVKSTSKFSPLIIEKDEIKVLNDAILDAYYPGGHNAWWKFITSNYKFTKQITETNASGEILVQFKVNKKGDVEEPKIILRLNKACDVEMLRVFSKMPKWHPYLKRGKPVNINFQIPIYVKVEHTKGKKKLTLLRKMITNQ